WDFIVADVSIPIIGADFLTRFDLLVDVGCRKLVDRTTKLQVSAVPARHVDYARLTTLSPNLPNDFKSLLQEYREITTPRPALHDIRHHIATSNGPPVFAHARRLPPQRLEVAKKEFRALQDAGFIRPSSSPWSSPLHMV